MNIAELVMLAMGKCFPTDKICIIYLCSLPCRLPHAIKGSLLKDHLQFYAYIETSNVFKIHNFRDVTPYIEVYFSSYSLS